MGSTQLSIQAATARTMDLYEDFLLEDFLLCDDSCLPPPVMLVPPPPPPPWMEEIPDCSSHGDCGNYPVISSINSATSIFHMTSVIIVVGITSFILFAISVVLLWRTKKKSSVISKVPKAISEDDQYKQRCCQNQYVDSQPTIISTQKLSPIQNESKEAFERKI